MAEASRSVPASATATAAVVDDVTGARSGAGWGREHATSAKGAIQESRATSHFYQNW